MSKHNIGFYEDLTKIIFELSSNIIKYTPYFFCCYKTFLWSVQLSMKVKLLINLVPESMEFSGLNHKSQSFILHINVSNHFHLIIYVHDKFALLS